MCITLNPIIYCLTFPILSTSKQTLKDAGPWQSLLALGHWPPNACDPPLRRQSGIWATDIESKQGKLGSYGDYLGVCGRMDKHMGCSKNQGPLLVLDWITAPAPNIQRSQIGTLILETSDGISC